MGCRYARRLPGGSLPMEGRLAPVDLFQPDLGKIKRAMKIFFLLNPSSAKNRWDWREIAARHAKRQGWTPRFGEVDRHLPQSSDRLLDQALEEDCSRVVVLGGDGSLHRTINALG